MPGRLTVSHRLRRYPALGFLAVAALLASLLPSALRVPLSGPTASAELAPVPGKSDVAQGDLSALGQTSTGGLGAGNGLDGLGSGGRGSGEQRAEVVPGDPPPPGTGRNPANKRCVGKPPRQTEDPLSPPCVAYFKGDNGGVTAKGVTGEEIRVVVFLSCALTETPPRLSEVSDGSRLASYAKYFNERFQTYGRRVRLWDWRADCTLPASALLADVDEKVDPFAILTEERIFHGPNGGWRDSYAAEAARRGIVVTFHGAARGFMQARTPYVLSYPPDLEETAAGIVEFVCARLAGRPARFAPDPALRIATRRFGLLYDIPKDSPRLGADLIRGGIRERCGDLAGSVVHEENTTTGRSRMRAEGVTTVIYAAPQETPLKAQTEGWQPEWLITSLSTWTDNTSGNNNVSSAGAIGLTTRRNVDEDSRNNHTVAVQEGCHCGDFSSDQPGVYDNLLLLFTGIQAAGPRLTVQNMDRGLRAIPPHQSPDPRRPAAYFGPGDHSFVKDFAALRWDPAGTRPGNRGRPGCWRLVEGGKRYRAQDWASSPGDDMLTAEGQPCQGGV